MLTCSTEPDIITFPGGIHPRKSIRVWQVPYHMTPSASSSSHSSTTFYTSLLEEPSLRLIQSSWLEALADLACYRMAIAGMVINNQLKGPALTTDDVSKVAADIEPEKECLGKSSPFICPVLHPAIPPGAPPSSPHSPLTPFRLAIAPVTGYVLFRYAY
ncbi:uncharacterized protein EDB91DRAFT_1245237 [Suillus paluster]|uniref:uncharacterized protein n=1 Tax=Suillus paluster TaxID=48578 RepID=UPI001B87245F|nr:uncharacterized protein EDB91DRAFT_1245237 [Suillus paluster]KAG1747749.1 hypothetical protein EDB91DRAFT_1245237 [Suillus paluster]